MDRTEAALWDRRPATRNQLYDLYADRIDRVIDHMLIGMRLPPRIDVGPLRSGGRVAALRAIEQFDLYRGTDFLTYATWRIRGGMLDEMRSLDIRRTLRAAHRRRLEVECSLYGRLMREPTVDEVCAELGWTNRQYVLSLAREAISVERFADSNRPDTIDTIAIDTIGIGSDLRDEDVFRDLCRSLSMREQTVMYLLYCCQATMKQVGQVLGLSEARVSQMHSSIVSRLRDAGRDNFIHSLGA